MEENGGGRDPEIGPADEPQPLLRTKKPGRQGSAAAAAAGVPPWAWLALAVVALPLFIGLLTVFHHEVRARHWQGAAPLRYCWPPAAGDQTAPPALLLQDGAKVIAQKVSGELPPEASYSLQLRVVGDGGLSLRARLQPGVKLQALGRCCVCRRGVIPVVARGAECLLSQ